MNTYVILTVKGAAAPLIVPVGGGAESHMRGWNIKWERIWLRLPDADVLNLIGPVAQLTPDSFRRYRRGKSLASGLKRCFAETRNVFLPTSRRKHAHQVFARIDYVES